MALGFGRKKTTDDAAASAASTPLSSPVEAAPVPAHAPSSPPNDDLDAFDLDAFSASPAPNTPITASNTAANADPFGDFEVTQTVADSDTSSSTSSSTSGSAFDFPTTSDLGATPFEATTLSASEPATPDFDKLYEIEQANTVRSVAPAPFVPPTATVQEPAAPFYEPQVSTVSIVETEVKPKKKLPLVPILGALGILSLAGGAATYLSRQNAPDTDETVLVLPSKIKADRPAPPKPPKPLAPTIPVAPAPKVIGASPGIGPGTVLKVAPVNPGIAPVAGNQSQLKLLWKRGADAKHNGDYAGARRFWNQGLKIQPTNLGFKQSLAKMEREIRNKR